MDYSFENNIAIYIQILEKIKLEIISGKLKPNEKLLSVRELAVKFKVNPNTIQKSLIELERINLIYTERTNGKYVTNDIELINKLKEEIIQEKVASFLNDMNNIGINKQDIKRYLNKLEV